MQTFERSPNREVQEKYHSKIALSFFRHGEKENDPSKSDFDIALTPTGRKQAIDKSATMNIRQAVAFGSPRARTQETAAFVLSGNQEVITGEESLEELKSKLDKNLAKGSKVRVDARLDFKVDFSSQLGKASLASFKQGEYLKFLVEQSDKLAEETGDETSFTYARGAAAVASIIDKYVKVAKRWDALVEEGRGNYSNTLERFFGTHQGVIESFLAKVIEKTRGIEARDAFVRVLNNQGFDFVEGFTVDISSKDPNESILNIKYKKGEVFAFDETVPMTIVKEIMFEGQSSKEIIEQLPTVEWRGERLIDSLKVSNVPLDNPPDYIHEAKEKSSDFLYESVNLENPVLFVMGHNGTHVPVSEMKDHTADGITCEASIDYGADHVVPPGFSFIGTRVSRYIADHNRPQTTERGSGTGGGAFWSQSILDKKPMYDIPPSEERIAELVKKFHTPFYQRIGEIIDQIKKKHGFCIVVDCHSFGVHDLTKDYYSYNGIKEPSKALALFIVGINEDEALDPVLSNLLRYFESEVDSQFGDLSEDRRNALLHFTNGKAFSLNEPFSGGNIVKEFNDPQNNIYTVQIESNRGALTHTMEDDNYFSGRIKDDNAAVIRGIMQNVMGKASELMKDQIKGG